MSDQREIVAELRSQGPAADALYVEAADMIEKLGSRVAELEAAVEQHREAIRQIDACSTDIEDEPSFVACGMREAISDAFALAAAKEASP